MINVRRFWGKKRGRNPKRWNILYDDCIVVPDNLQARQILLPGKQEVVFLMQRKNRK